MGEQRVDGPGEERGDIVMIGECGVGERRGSKEARGKEKMMRECEVGGKCGDVMIRREIWCGV